VLKNKKRKNIMKILMKTLENGEKVEKSFVECSIIEKLAIERGIAKAFDTPSAFRIGGQLLPDDIYTSLQAISDSSKFLKSIRTEFIKGTTADLNMLTVSENGTVRPNYGTASTDSRNVSNLGNKLTLNGMQSSYLLAYDAIQEKLNRPNFQSELETLLITAAAKDLAKIALKGTTDTPSGTQHTEAYMLTLGTGFPTLFAADPDVVDVTYANTDMIALFKLMDESMKEDYADSEDNTFYVSRADYIAYGDQLNALNATGTAFIEGKPLFYNGHPIMWVPQMPASKAFYASSQNLVVAYNVDGMKMDVIDEPRKAGYDIIMNYMADFGYFNGTQIVFAS
jgi:hypothetical protein